MGHSSAVLSASKKWMQKYIDSENKFDFEKVLNISYRLGPGRADKLPRLWFCTSSASVFQNTKGNLYVDLGENADPQYESRPVF